MTRSLLSAALLPAAFLIGCGCSLLAAPVGRADEPAAESAQEVLAGHSLHGEAFNEGPRQAAYLMKGMGSTRFASSASDEATQAFIDQGVAQLHGFWYFEAERSFRQAATLQPDLAIAYWGMAMANAANVERATDFIAEAEQRLEKASAREKAYIQALAKYLRSDQEIRDQRDLTDDQRKSRRRDREQDYIQALERILDESPEDTDALALLALQLWTAGRNELPITSHYAVDALLDRVFAAQPDHPAHHYRIHLWDRRRPKNALESAARCGPSLPGVAHMWHMPGHIYSRLHRYADAAWQQEASARVDHAHMIRDRVLPDQIHNFAHNNEWLIRNLLFLGRTQDAISQAENLIALPRHPKHNTIEKQGSHRYGRERLIDAYSQYELWPQLIAACDRAVLAPTEDFQDRIQRQKWLIVALQLTGQARQANEQLRELQLQRLDLQRSQVLAAQQAARKAEQSGAADDAEAETAAEGDPPAVELNEPAPIDPKKAREQVEKLRQAIALGAAAGAVRRKDAKALEKRLAAAGKVDGVLRALWLEDCGNTKQALESIRQTVKESPGQVRPQAASVYLLWKAGEKEEARKEFAELREMAANADLDSPLMARISPIAKEFGAEVDWRTPPPPASDVGERPALDTLGPARWVPSPMPSWSVQGIDGGAVDASSLEGQPTLLIFYLGFGCLHCVEQLAAFSPHLGAFQNLGIQVIGISSESTEELQRGIKNYDGAVAIPLHANESLEAFKAFRCYDDFEQQPLHGAFLIDERGRVRWQDIGHEPFTDVTFLLDEAPRLLQLTP